MTDTEISFTFAVVDNISPVAREIAANEDNLAQATARANTNIDSQNIKFITQLASVMAVYRGMNMTITSMKTFGLVNNETAESLTKVAHAVGLVAGVFMMLKGAVKIVNALKAAELGLAVVETYRAVLNNPAKLALVGLASAGAGLAAGFLLGAASGGGGGSGTQVTQTINFNTGESVGGRSVARDALEFMGG